MRLILQDSYEQMSLWAAHLIKNRVMQAQAEKRSFVLGLPTGSSPLGTYQALIEMNQRGEIDFSHVHTFNMDEYLDLEPDHPQSYRSFMQVNFFNHINIPQDQIHLLQGKTLDPKKECLRYEAEMKALGGIDLFMGGIGADGHIAFNEPGSSLHSRTRVKTLTQDTRIMNARFFGGNPQAVPPKALTVGVGTIMDSKEVLILANGHAKARAIQKVVEEGINHMWTLSMLQMHPRGIIVCTDDAAVELKLGTYRYFKEIEQANLAPEQAGNY